MAPRNKQTASGDPVAGTTAIGDSKPIQNQLEAKKKRFAFMEEVRDLAKATMSRRDIDAREKKSILMDELIKKGTTDEDIAYIMSKGPNKEFFGFTFAEMNNLRDEIETIEMLAEKRNGSFVEREQTRRAQQQPRGRAQGE